MRDLPQSSQHLLEQYLTSSLSLNEGYTSNDVTRSVPNTLEAFFADRYIENTIPIIVDKNRLLIIGLYCMNLDKMRFYPKMSPKLMVDIRFWGTNPIGQVYPTKQGIMLPLKIIKEFIPRLFGLQNKYEMVKTLDSLKSLFDPYNLE